MKKLLLKIKHKYLCWMMDNYRRERMWLEMMFMGLEVSKVEVRIKNLEKNRR